MEDGVSTYTVDEALVSMGFGKFHAFVLAYSGMAKISEAMEMMLLSFVGQSVQAEWELSAQAESLITSVVFVGMLVGAYAWGIVSDNYGRRQVLLHFLFSIGCGDFIMVVLTLSNAIFCNHNGVIAHKCQ
jgi:MFS family permease